MKTENKKIKLNEALNILDKNLLKYKTGANAKFNKAIFKKEVYKNSSFDPEGRFILLKYIGKITNLKIDQFLKNNNLNGIDKNNFLIFQSESLKNSNDFKISIYEVLENNKTKTLYACGLIEESADKNNFLIAYDTEPVRKQSNDKTTSFILLQDVKEYIKMNELKEKRAKEKNFNSIKNYYFNNRVFEKIRFFNYNDVKSFNKNNLFTSYYYHHSSDILPATKENIKKYIDSSNYCIGEIKKDLEKRFLKYKTDNNLKKLKNYNYNDDINFIKNIINNIRNINIKINYNYIDEKNINLIKDFQNLICSGLELIQKIKSSNYFKSVEELKKAITNFNNKFINLNNILNDTKIYLEVRKNKYFLHDGEKIEITRVKSERYMWLKNYYSDRKSYKLIEKISNNKNNFALIIED